MRGRVSRSHPPADVVVELVVSHRRLDDRGGSFLERYVDLLPVAGRVAMVERDQRSGDSLQAGEVCALVGASPERLAVGLARYMCHATGGPAHEVASAPVGARAGLAERRNRDEDQRRMLSLEITEQLDQLTGRKIFDDDVRALDKGSEAATTSIVVQFEPSAALANVQAQERIAPCAGPERVALTALDLDDIGPELGQKLPCVGAGDVRGKLDNADAFERAIRSTGLARRHRPSGCRLDRVELRHDLVGVRAEERRLNADAGWGLREHRHRPGGVHRTELRVGDRHPESTCAEVLVVEGVRNGRDSGCRYAVLLQLGGERLGLALGDELTQRRVELFAALDPAGERVELCRGERRRPTQHREKTAPLLLVATLDRDPAILALASIDAVRRVERAPVATRVWHVSRDLNAYERLGELRGGGLEHREVEPAPATGPPLFPQRS